MCQPTTTTLARLGIRLSSTCCAPDRFVLPKHVLFCCKISRWRRGGALTPPGATVPPESRHRVAGNCHQAAVNAIRMPLSEDSFVMKTFACASRPRWSTRIFSGLLDCYLTLCRPQRKDNCPDIHSNQLFSQKFSHNRPFQGDMAPPTQQGRLTKMVKWTQEGRRVRDRHETCRRTIAASSFRAWAANLIARKTTGKSCDYREREREARRRSTALPGNRVKASLEVFVGNDGRRHSCIV